MSKTNLDQILVPGIIDYCYSFIEACEKTNVELNDRYHVHFENSKETVIIRITDISYINVEENKSQRAKGERRLVYVGLQNGARFAFTYQTGNAIRTLWKRKMKSPGSAFSYDQDLAKQKQTNKKELL